MNLLFICSRNQWRSPTAEKIFQGYDGHQAKSAGTSPSARVRVNEKHILWAEVIFVMERKHLEILKERFDDVLSDKKIHVLQIPDEYTYMDDDLVMPLKETVESLLHLQS